MRPLSWTTAVLVACGGAPEAATSDPLALDGLVVGPLVGHDDVVVGVLDASTWRRDEVEPISTLTRWDAGTGRFTLRLPERVDATRPWETFFVAAWRDLDGDGRRDRAAEALCDQPREGEVVYLTYPRDASIPGGWAIGADRRHVDDVGRVVSIVLDSTRCATY